MTVNESFYELQKARLALKQFNSELTLEQGTLLTVGDPTTVEVMGLKNTQRMLLQNIIDAEQEYRDAKKEAKAH